MGLPTFEKKCDADWQKRIEEEKLASDSGKPDKPDGIVRLTIELHPDNSVRVSGPITDKLLCFGMLEVAKQVIANARPPSKSPNRGNTRGAFGGGRR